MLMWQYIAGYSVVLLCCTHLMAVQGLDREERRRERRRQRLQGIAVEEDYEDRGPFNREDRQRNKEERRQDKLERREERREERRRLRVDGSDVTALNSETGPHSRILPALHSEVRHVVPYGAAKPRPVSGHGKPSRHRGGKPGNQAHSRLPSNGEPPSDGEKIYGKHKEAPVPMNLEWLAANVSSLWHVVRNLQQHLTYRHQKVRNPNGRRGHPETTGEECPGGNEACRGEEDGAVCDSHGICDCGNCDCDPGYYGTYCQCNDHSCHAYNGMACGGPSRGQCRCGDCVCRPGYVGDACQCSTDTSSCHKEGEEDMLCSNQGTCECGNCKCSDGYQGQYCSDNVYAAGVCERLKPCVLCKAWNKEIPQCVECKVTLSMVDSLEPGMKTCVMVSKGCLLQYSYNAEPGGAYSVQVPKNMTCSSA